MKKHRNNYAFVDSQNINLAIRGLGWRLDFNKLEAILIPDRFRFSALLKFKIFRRHLRYMNDLESRLAYKKKRPREDGTSQGNLSHWGYQLYYMNHSKKSNENLILCAFSATMV